MIDFILAGHLRSIPIIQEVMCCPRLLGTVHAAFVLGNYFQSQAVATVTSCIVTRLGRYFLDKQLSLSSVSPRWKTPSLPGHATFIETGDSVWFALAPRDSIIHFVLGLSRT